MSDEALLRGLTELLAQSRRVESDLLAHLGEVDERGLFAREACASMFSYCTEVLHLSEGEAYLRIGVARASRKFPLVLEMIADGRLHLSGAAKLAPHLTSANHESVLGRAAHRSKRQIEELVAELSPRPDVPAVIRRLPALKAARPELRPDAVKFEMPAAPSPPAPSALPPPPVVQVLAPTRHKVQFTASGELREKLERLQALMNADLAEAIESAVTEKIERLEARRFAEAKTPRKSLGENRYDAQVPLHPGRGEASGTKSRRRPMSFRERRRPTVHREAPPRVPPSRSVRPGRRP